MACGEVPAALTHIPSTTTNMQSLCTFFFQIIGGCVVSLVRSRCAAGLLAAFGRPRPSPLPLCACALCGRGRGRARRSAVSGLPFSARWGCGRWCAFLLVFSVLRPVLFGGWGGFFGCWGGLFGGWGVGSPPSFFVSLSRGWFLLLWSVPVPLGFCRVWCFRVLSRVRLVRAGGSPCPGLAWAPPFGARGRGLPAFRLLALRPSWLLLVGWLVGRCCLRCLAGGVGGFGGRSRAWRPAVALFLVFFKI